MHLFSKTQQKHPGDLTPTVPDLPPPPSFLTVQMLFFPPNSVKL